MDEKEIKQIMWKLANFEPSSTDEYGNQVLDYLVLDALSSYGPLLCVVPNEIKEYIKKVFKIEFEEIEIFTSTKRLQVKGYVNIIEPTRKSENPQIMIEDGMNQKILSNTRAIQDLETSVFDEWKSELLEKYKLNPIVKDKIEDIISCFKEFLSTIMLRHGIECVNLLYPDESKAQKWLESVKGSIIDNLPKVESYIDAVIKIEIPDFFLKQNERRVKYLNQLFNSSFLWHLVQVDEKCSSLFKNVTSGQRLFLDNNVLYNLVGFNGEVVLRSAHKTLELAQKLGYELWVTSKTISEYHESLNWHMGEYKKKLPIPTELARIAVNNLGEQSFITSYWSVFVELGLSIEEFVAEKSHIEEIINNIGIKKTDEFRNEIEGSDALMQEIAILNGVTDFPLNPNIVEHDAFHRVFINKIRGGEKFHFRDSIAWFLTNDSKLPVYDRIARKGRSNLPFCITIDQWIQVNRPLLARTANKKDFEESFHILVTQPFVRAMTSSINLDKAYQDVLGKLAKYEHMNPQLAFQIVTDIHFMHSVSDEDNYDVPQEKLENKFIDIAEELRKLNEKNSNRMEEERESASQKITSLEKKNRTLRSIIKWISFIFLVVPLSFLIWMNTHITQWIQQFFDGRFFLVHILLQLIVLSLGLLIPLWKFKNFLLGTVFFSLMLELILLLS